MDCLTSFLILALNEPYESIERTLLSIKSFKDQIFKRVPDNAQVICMCGEGTNSYLHRLKKYSNDCIKIISYKDFSKISTGHVVDVGPEIFILCHYGLLMSMGCEIVVIVQPGMIIKSEYYDKLSSIIKMVGKDCDLIAISKDDRLIDQPHSIVFDQLIMSSSGYLKTAIYGFDVKCKKPLFGDLKYKRTESYPDGAIFNVPWLIRAIAYDAQHDSNKTTKLFYEQWI